MAQVLKLTHGVKFLVQWFCIIGTLILVIEGAFAKNLHLASALAPNAPSFAGTTTKPPIANLCPASDRIQPCTCYTDAILCMGYISQEDVNKLMAEFRDVNGVASDEFLRTNKGFYIERSSLTTFDLTPLLNSQFRIINIHDNAELSQIHGPNSSTYFTSIDVNILELNNNNLTDEGLSDFFHYFSPSLVELYVDGNPIQGPSSKIGESEFLEFFPGLWKFVNLQYLNLQSSWDITLENGPFKALSSLKDLRLGCVEEVGENALLFDDDDDETTNAVLVRRVFMGGDEILNSCPLSDDSFHRNHGLEFYKGHTKLYLWYNSFEFLHQEKFEPFLQINVNNTIDCNGNPFVCDERMKWLKDQRESYENRVLNVFCANDPGHTIFNTTLV